MNRAELLFVLAAIILVVGVSLIYVPAGVITAGLALGGISLLVAAGAKRDE